MAKQATKPSNQLQPAQVNLPVDVEEFETDRSGLENVTAADVVIPRLTILQKMSPQVDSALPEYIEGAQVGMFCDVSTGDLFKDKLEVVPCYFARVFLEWFPRDSKKGLAANHGMDASILSKAKPDARRRMTLPNGNYVAETATYYVLNITAGGKRSFIPLSSTQLKNSRKWMTLISGERVKKADGGEFQPAIYYRSWIATPIDESNADGNWKGWKFSPGRRILEIDPSKKLLAEAKAFYHDAKEGLVRGDLSTHEEGEVTQQESDDKPL